MVADCRDGSYASKYTPGDLMYLDLGSEGKICMRLVGIDKDVREDGTTVPMTWLALGILNTKQNLGFAYVEPKNITHHFTEVANQPAGTRKWDSRTMYHASSTYHACADTFTVTANENLDITITAYCESEPHWDVMSVVVNGTDYLANMIGDDPGDRVSRTYRQT